MNKLTMPAILVATVMVAGMFAFIPVEQASTVHLSSAGQGQSITIASGDEANDQVSITCGSSSVCVIIEMIGHETSGSAALQTEEVSLTHGSDTRTFITDLGIDIPSSKPGLILHEKGIGPITLGPGDKLVMGTALSTAFDIHVIHSGEVTVSIAQ